MITFYGAEANGKVDAPPSKSYTHRALFISSLAEGSSRLRNPLRSYDIDSTANVLRSFGADIRNGYRSLNVNGGNLIVPSEVLDAGNSGTTMRFAASVASLFDKEVTIDGDDSLRKRPMTPLLNALESMGAVCSSQNGCAPISIKGPIDGGLVSIDGNISSQFLSSLLIVAPVLSKDCDISVENLVSRPYADMTVSVMRTFGANVDVSENGFCVSSNGYRPANVKIPGDASSAAYMLVAGALGGKVAVKGLNEDSGGDMRIVNILRDAGAKVTMKKNTVTAEIGEFHPVDIDISDVPDLFPILSVFLSVADGTSRIRNVSRLRYKESDRVRATIEMINGLGGSVEMADDDVIIHGKDHLNGGHVNCHEDHRIMIAAGVASLTCDSPVTVDGDCSSVSYPNYLAHMDRIGVIMEIE